MDHWNICRTRDPKLWSLKLHKQIRHFCYFSPINVVVKYFSFNIQTYKREQYFMVKRLDFNGVSVYSGGRVWELMVSVPDSF